MGNKDAKKTTSFIDQDRSRIGTEHGQDRSYIQGAIGRETPYSTGLRDEIVGGYRNLAGGKDASGNPWGSGGSGGYTGASYNPQLVGLDPKLAGLEGRYEGLSGGLDRALGGYDELAKTGGYTDADRANIRSRSADTGTAMFGNLRNEMTRRNAVAGGLGVGGGANAARMAREQAIAQGKNVRDTELGINEAVRQGKLAGLGGQERIGTTGYGGATDIANTRQRIAELNAEAQNQAAAFNASHAASASNMNTEQAARMQLAGLGGMQEMYGASPGELARYDEMLLRERGLTDQGMQGNLGQRIQNVGPQQSPWDRATQLVGGAAGLAGAFYNPVRKTKVVQ